MNIKGQLVKLDEHYFEYAIQEEYDLSKMDLAQHLAQWVIDEGGSNCSSEYACLLEIHDIFGDDIMMKVLIKLKNWEYST